MSRSYLNRHLTSTENKSNTRHVNDTPQKPHKRVVNAPQKTRRKPIDAPQIRTRPKNFPFAENSYVQRPLS